MSLASAPVPRVFHLDRAGLTWRPIASAWGEFQAGFSAQGLAALHFPGGTLQPAEPAPSPALLEWCGLVEAALALALAGRSTGCLPPLDLSGGTAFQQVVWKGMGQIPLGQTQSYGELAEAIGLPKAVRAVGQACGANPVPVFVPCHRVLAAGRRLGGFSAGLAWKTKLLTAERVFLPGLG